MSGPGRLLGHGQHPGGPDTRQIPEVGRPQEGWMGRQGKLEIFYSQKEIRHLESLLRLKSIIIEVNDSSM